MADIDRFASDGNISCFADQLRYETVPARQEMLKRLLIEEENLFAATQDRLRMVERKFTEGGYRQTKETDRRNQKQRRRSQQG